jgi:Na+/melibiose symporter-like transporter
VIRDALRRPGLRALLGAGLISLTGDWVVRVGLAYAIYALTGSTLTSALMLLASFVPQILLGSLAGVLVDRWDPRRTMILADLLLAAGLLPLLAVHEPGDVWIVYAVLAFEGTVQQFFAPAEQAALPTLAGERLVTANALAAQSRDVSRLLGSALGGVLVAAGGIGPLVAFDAASFVASAALIARVPRLRAPERGTGGGFAREWRAGLALATRHRVLRAILLFLAVTCVGEGIFGTLFAPFVRAVLHGGGGDYGVISAAQAIGGIAGGLAAASLGDRLEPVMALGAGALAFGALDLALFLYPLAWTPVWPAVVLIAAAGLPGALVFAGAMTLMQRHAGDGLRGRVFGALGVVEGVAVVAGTLGAGLLAQTLGIVPVLAAQGAGYVLAGAAVLALLRDSTARVRSKRMGRARLRRAP